MKRVPYEIEIVTKDDEACALLFSIFREAFESGERHILSLNGLVHPLHRSSVRVSGEVYVGLGLRPRVPAEDILDRKLLEAYRKAWRACAGHLKVTVEEDYPPWRDEGGMRTLRRPEPTAVPSRTLRVLARAGTRRLSFEHQYVCVGDEPDLGAKLACTRMFLDLATAATAHVDRCIGVES